MDRFPSELLDLRDPSVNKAKSLRETGSRFAWFPNPISESVSVKCLGLLNDHMANSLNVYRSRIPGDSISGMRRNYGESLEKTFSNRMAILNSKRAKAARIAEDIGLLEMMRSPSTLSLAERLSGYRLVPGPGCQVICYEEGDHAGPHNDHHPEDKHLRGGYIDLHVTFCEPNVDHQWFVYEHKGYLSKLENVAASSGVSVSHLPFWHYVTPLAKKSGAKTARRWLLLCSFEKLQQ